MISAFALVVTSLFTSGSDSSDLALWRFDSLDRSPWKAYADPGSSLQVKLDSTGAERFLRLDYRIQQWANTGETPRILDWSSRGGVVLRARGHKASSSVQVALVDATGEQWIASGRVYRFSDVINGC
jgi:hypothetical protein